MQAIQLVINQIKEELGTRHIFVAVSGGVDSMLMLELAREHFAVTALHVNYQLRGNASELDEEFVRDYCLKNNIDLVVFNYDLGSELQLKKSNLQNRAREIRYDFFRKQLEQSPESFLFIAHHADDQVETFFIQYFRNAGIAGLSGMKLVTNRLVRPFLTFTKTELTTYAQEIGLSWREDQSNKKNDYLRNKFRNQLIPELEKEIPTIRKSVLKMMDCLSENQTVLEKEAMYWVERIKSDRQIEISEVCNLSKELTIELFHQLGMPTSYLVGWNNLINAQKGSKLVLSNCNLLTSIIREENSFYFQFVNSDNKDVPHIKVTSVNKLPENFSKSTIYFDKQKIKGDFSIRLWQIGDRIYPLGLKGSKLISDVLTTAKVPHAERSNQWLLCDEEKILTCINHCIDRRAIASPQTKDILGVEIQ
jgi:tRNA(Ile)-lysidine synthase